MSKRALIRLVLVVVFVGGVWWGATDDRKDPAQSLPRIAKVPAFDLVDQHGRQVNGATLAGYPWIANFIFTSCPTTCPLLTADMARLQQKLNPKTRLLRFVSFSVDPERDTPAKLKAFALKHKADQRNWFFVTGPAQHVHEVIVKGFKMPLDRREDAKPGEENILHGSHFVLVDHRGVIRGFYRSDKDGLRHLAYDAEMLATRSKT
ncbi:MAG: SCO family protein [Proteobacteria bacterium]|nr:SCO family protein [Pseudomonadota bacterium]